MNVFVLFIGEENGDFLPLYGVYSSKDKAEWIADQILKDHVELDYLIEETVLDGVGDWA